MHFLANDRHSLIQKSSLNSISRNILNILYPTYDVLVSDMKVWYEHFKVGWYWSQAKIQAGIYGDTHNIRENQQEN